MKEIIIVFIVFMMRIAALLIPAIPNIDVMQDLLKEKMDNYNSDGIINKWAILIAAGGGPSYEHHVKLDRNDIRELKSTFISHGWQEDHIFILLEEATKNAILTEPFEWLQNYGKDEDDLIFFYFSMHGYNHTHDEPPLDESDVKDGRIHPWDPTHNGWNPDVYIIDDEFAASFSSIQSKNIVLVFHTCHSGEMIDGSEDLCGDGRVVLTSCNEEELSFFLYRRVIGLFPYYIIKGMNGFADRNQNGWISAEEFPIDWSISAGVNCAIDAKMAQEWVLIGDPSLKIGGYE